MKKIIYKICIIFCLVATVLEANTFTDKDTGLMWQDNIDAKTIKKDWQGAIKYCKNLKLSGYDDWRLPSIDELLSITDDMKYDPAIKSGFRNLAAGYYWSSSPDVSVSSNAWRVDFSDGGDYWGGKSNSFSSLVRCVRDSKDTSTFDTLDKIIQNYINLQLAKIAQPPKEITIVKDEFESTKEFEARVAQAKIAHQNEINRYNDSIQKAKEYAKQIAIKKALQTIWGKPILSDIRYDADNGYFVANLSFEAKIDFTKTVAIKIDRAFARDFKSAFASLKPQAVFDYDGSSITLKEIVVPYAGQKLAALFTDAKLSDTKVAVNIKNDFDTNIGASSNVKVAQNDVAKLDTTKLRDPNELDRILGNTKAINPNKSKWLFVIGIEKYEFTDNISYASRSAEMFSKVAMKKLGVPKENSYVLINNDATQAKIKTALQKLLNRVKDGDEIYFYYNGHGIPVAKENFEPYMLASDTEPDFVDNEKFFALNNIYGLLSNSKASKVVALVDSCFSGATDGKSVLKGVAATKMRPKVIDFDKSKMVVMTAGKGYQYSNGYDKKGYRMFSYFAMKSILQSDSQDINISDIYKQIKNETYEASLEEYGDLRAQEPQLEGNEKLRL